MDLLADLVGDVLAEVKVANERMPVIRVAGDYWRDRLPIPPAVRGAVQERDGKHCSWCGSTRSLQMDHIEPWSALGWDWSENLRTLCASCNLRRSNRRTDVQIVRVLPVSGGCRRCMDEIGLELDELTEPLTDRTDDLPVFCGICGMGGTAPEQWQDSEVWWINCACGERWRLAVDDRMQLVDGIEHVPYWSDGWCHRAER